MNSIKQQSGNPSANTTGNFECKPMYFQRAPFAPPKLNTIPTNVFDTIDPLDWVSLPDLFFGENYQNMLPTLDPSAGPDNCTSVFSPDPNLQPQGQGRPYMQRYEICDTATQEISRLQSFPPEKVNDFKHVIYNLLVDNYNNPQKNSFVQPCTIEENGVIRQGFCFNENDNPEKKLPELYAQHIRKARLDQEDISSVFVHDLYKFYLRASVELLSKYFEKRDKYTYLYEDVPLFMPSGTLEQAEERIRNMKTRARKKRKILPS